MGKFIETNSELKKTAVSAALSEVEAVTLMDASLDQSCYREEDCIKIDMSRCDRGYSLAGWDLEKCEARYPFKYVVNVFVCLLFTFILSPMLTCAYRIMRGPSAANRQWYLTSACGVEADQNAMGSATRAR